MGPPGSLLIAIGFCLNWAIGTQPESLHRPTLWAFPSPVVPMGADVTLRCQGRLGTDRSQLWMDGKLREERRASRGLAEFMLTRVENGRDARSYSCRSGQGPWWSEFSDPLALVVTGILPEPSIGILPGYKMIPGSRVTIWCKISPHTSSQDYTFALLEAENLEPLELQSPKGTRAVFSRLSVRVEDIGSYRCIYYKKAAPHSGSQPSNTVHLTVDGPLPKPTLWAKPGLVMDPGANITLWCSRPKLSIGEVTFTLRKAGLQKPLEQQTSEYLWTSFLFQSVKPEDTGSYSCVYRERTSSGGVSEPSNALKLVVKGSLPRPFLSAIPGLVVEPGIYVILRCWLPPQGFLSDVTFSLLKVGTPQPLQSHSPAGPSVDFLLFSVRAQDSGNYSCVYHRRTAPYIGSEPSDLLEIWVTDAFPKPSLSAWPGPSGADVTLLCRAPSWATGFLLHKEDVEKQLKSTDSSQDGAHFFLTHVTPKDSGNYSCSYQLSTNGSFWTQHSDPLQIIVRGSLPSITLIIILSCVSFILLCLLLLVFLCQRFNPMGSSQANRPSSSCLLHHSVVSREHALNTEVAKERSRQSLVSMTEEPQGMSYAHLNQRTLNNRKFKPMEETPEPLFYASFSWN